MEEEKKEAGDIIKTQIEEQIELLKKQEHEKTNELRRIHRAIQSIRKEIKFKRDGLRYLFGKRKQKKREKTEQNNE